MGGLVLDVFIIYLLRVLIRAWKQRGSSRWELTQTNIADISSQPRLGPVVELVYLYKINHTEYSGMESIPFVWSSSAKEYVRKHPQGSIVAVRVNPSQPAQSTLRDRDQPQTVSQVTELPTS